MNVRQVDVLVIGGSLAAAATAKRLTDAGYETVVLERKKLPRHKICSGILSPRGLKYFLILSIPQPEVANRHRAHSEITAHPSRYCGGHLRIYPDRHAASTG